jgi:hypothetical protein
VNPEALVMLIPLGGIALGGLFLVGVYKLLARWMDRSRLGGSAALSEEVARLREEVDVLRDVSQRVAELEERLDFTERMLSQQREPGRLARGGE